MKTLNILNGPQNISAIIHGCMRMIYLSKEDAAKVNLSHHDRYVLYLASGRFLY